MSFSFAQSFFKVQIDMTQLIFKEKKRVMIAGLDWSVLQHYRSGNTITREVRTIAGDHGADRIIIHAANVAGMVSATIGTANLAEIEGPTGREQHSLAAVFARAYPENANMVLAWRLDSAVAIVVVQDGLPVVDMLKADTDALAFLEAVINGSFGCLGHTIYSNETEIHPFAELISESQLWTCASKSTRLTKIPLKRSVAMLGTLAAVLIAASVYYYDQEQSSRRLAAAQAALDAENPMPSYQAALTDNIGALGFERASIKATLAQLQNYPVWSQGWMLRKIECDRSRCVSFWDRMGGTTNTLIAARQQETYLAESNEEVSLFAWKSKLKSSGLSSLSQFETESQATIGNINTFQLWRNAGIAIDEPVKDFVTWPKPPIGDGSRLPRGSAVIARPISVTAPFPFAEDIINGTPASVWWQSIAITFSPGGKSEQLKITLKGTTYVR
ncbi:hypothetical protein ACWYXJ_00235 [Janthinobacterium lividum]